MGILIVSDKAQLVHKECMINIMHRKLIDYILVKTQNIYIEMFTHT